MKKNILIWMVNLALCAGSALTATAQDTTAFTYSGRLLVGEPNNRVPANGSYALRFRLYGSPELGSHQAEKIQSVSVANGLFMTTLNFGPNIFRGAPYWLELAVPDSMGQYPPVNPRTQITPMPYALFAPTAGTAVSVPWSALTDIPPGIGSEHNHDVTYVNVAGDTMTGLLRLAPRGLNVGGGQLVVGDNVVGIGTGGASPDYALTVQASAGADAISWRNSAMELGRLGHSNGNNNGSLLLNKNGSPNVSILANGNSYFNGGKVGIGTGTASPGYALTVQAPTGTDAISWRNNDGAELGRLGYAVEDGESGWLALFQDNSKYVEIQAAGDSYFNGGKVGIGTASPSVALEVKSPSDAEIGVRSGDVGGHLWTIQSSGVRNGSRDNTFQIIDRTTDRVGMIIYPDDLRVSVHVLSITGGADIAEPFPMSTRDLPKGSVVVIDENHPGQLRLGDRAYDTRVAGIISGAGGVSPGIQLKQEGLFEGGQNVALSGRVYVLADTASGPIEPGDLLTTSDTPGHAMKVAHHARAQGAILGKAMSALAEGKGLVLVLVSLQ